PETQSGYTIRTHETVKAQRAIGLKPVVSVQGGVSEAEERYRLDDIEYIPLITRPRRSTLRSEWLRDNVRALIELCVELRPAVLHAHSDYFNAMITEAAGKALGIPVVYEQRGFWEETWWSRTVDSGG